MASVFIVDDNKSWVQSLTVEFEKHAQFTVAGVRYDGLLALEFIRKERPDVICVDMVLPGADGVTIIENIRNDMPDYNPILVMVSAQGSDDVVSYLTNEMGVQFYTTKSSGPEKIVKRISGIFAAKLEAGAAGTTERAISHVVDKLGLKENNESTITVAMAIKMLLDEPNSLITKDVYPHIATVRDSNEKAVEKNIRNAVKRAEKQKTELYQQIFQVGIKPSNGQFVQSVVEYINENFR